METSASAAHRRDTIRRPDLWLLLAVLLFAALVRVRLLDAPLERDEGEYAYAGQLILEGVAPYDLAYNMKFPGTYGAYAVILAFLGQTAAAVHLGLLLVNGATIVFVFFLARRLSGPRGAAAAAATFALLSLGRPVQGIFANAEHFVILFATGGFLLLLRALDRGRRPALFLSALLLGTAFLMKQQGGAFVAAGCLLVLFDGRRGGASHPVLRLGRPALFLLGALLPAGLTSLLLLAAGTFERFRFWTIDYARAYTGLVPLSAAGTRFLGQARNVVSGAPLLWAFAAAGAFVLAFPGRSPRRRLAPATFALFSLAALFPGLYFRPHYFVLFLPAAALLAGTAVDALASAEGRPFRPLLSGLVFLAALAFSLLAEGDFLFRMSPEQACRATYGLNPFVESPGIARFLRNNTGEEDTIGVLGSEPQIFFYAHRRSATGYIYMYPLMEKHRFALGMQREMIAQIEAAEPAFLVYVRNVHSWGHGPDSPTLLLDWFGTYRDAHYGLAALVEMYPTRDDSHWGPDVPWPPRTETWIALLKRRN